MNDLIKLAIAGTHHVATEACGERGTGLRFTCTVHLYNMSLQGPSVVPAFSVGNCQAPISFVKLLLCPEGQPAKA